MAGRYQQSATAAIVSFSLQLSPLACRSSLNVVAKSLVDLFSFCRQLMTTQLRGGLHGRSGAIRMT